MKIECCGLAGDERDERDGRNPKTNAHEVRKCWKKKDNVIEKA